MQVLTLLVAVAVACSLVTVLGYGALLALTALHTMSGRARFRSLDEELDRFLADLLGGEDDRADHPPLRR